MLNFDLAELNSHKKKIFKSYTQATNKSSVIVFAIILLDSISDGSGTQNRICVHLESPTWTTNIFLNYTTKFLAHTYVEFFQSSIKHSYENLAKDEEKFSGAYSSNGTYKLPETHALCTRFFTKIDSMYFLPCYEWIRFEDDETPS